MTLYIVVKDSTPIRPIIKTICEKAGIVDYYILDPKSDDVDRPFRYVLFLGERTPKTTAFKEWTIPLRLAGDMPVADKQKVFQAFQAVKEGIAKESLQKPTVRSTDLPEIKDLDKFINEFKGSYFKLALADRRSVGIYPDGERLRGENDIEYHVSAVVNLVKIRDLFQPTSISIKEV